MPAVVRLLAVVHCVINAALLQDDMSSHSWFQMLPCIHRVQDANLEEQNADAERKARKAERLAHDLGKKAELKAAQQEGMRNMVRETESSRPHADLRRLIYMPMFSSADKWACRSWEPSKCKPLPQGAAASVPHYFKTHRQL